MATATQAKPGRTMRLSGDKLSITDERGRTETYTLQRIDDGETTLGYRLTKASDGAVYDIDLAAGTCDCIGHAMHSRCKHESAIRKLIDMRRI